MKESAHNAL